MHKKISQAGFSTLSLVLILSLLLELMLFSMLLASRVSANRASTTSYSQGSYFAAEGILHDSLLLLRQGNWPPQLPYDQKVSVGDVSVNRVVTFDQAKNEYTVEIESDFMDAKRKLVAKYVPAQTKEVQTSGSVDIVFVLDNSGSMRTVLTYLQNAVIQMIDSDTFSPQDRVAIIKFSTTAQLIQPFTSDKQKVKDAVRSLRLEGETNTQEALSQAQTLLQQEARPEANQVIIFFTDGMPTIAKSGNRVLRCGETCFNPSFGNTNAPDNGGNICTNATIQASQEIHSNSKQKLYGVFFAHQGGQVCKVASQNPELGRRTLKKIVGEPGNYFETNQIGELTGLFQTVGQTILESKNHSYQYQEVEPDEDEQSVL